MIVDKSQPERFSVHLHCISARWRNCVLIESSGRDILVNHLLYHLDFFWSHLLDILLASNHTTWSRCWPFAFQSSVLRESKIKPIFCKCVPLHISPSMDFSVCLYRIEEWALMWTLLNGSACSTERKYMRRYKRHLWCLLWNRAQIEEGGTVQQRGQGRMEVCSECSKNHCVNGRRWGS